jgi:hypothetical protein
MIKRVVSPLAAICFAASLAGCGSPASNITFNAPAGWKSTPGIFGRFQMWITGTDANNRQMVMLVRGDQGMKMEDSQSLSGTRGMHDFKRSTISLCGSQRGDYFVGRGEGTVGSPGGRRIEETVEGVTTTIGDSKYVALYIRPASMPADAQAEAALHSICPKG